MSDETKFLNAIRDYCISQGVELDEGCTASITLPMHGGSTVQISMEILTNTDAPLVYEGAVQVAPKPGKISNDPQ